MLRWLTGDGPGEGGGESGRPTGPQLCLVSVAEDFLALCNEGTAPAHNVRVDEERSSIAVRNRTDQAFDLAPGESWTFLIADLGPWQEAGWQLTVTLEGQEEPLCVPLSPGTLWPG